MNRAKLAIFAAILAACSEDPLSPEQNVAIVTSRQVYEPGEVVAVTLRNDGTRPIYLNRCLEILQLREATRWRALLDDGGCFDAASPWIPIVRGGPAITLEIPTAWDYPAGDYRILLDLRADTLAQVGVEDLGDNVSNIFRLE